MAARITVLAGNSGSGKTEIAVNRAIALARAGQPVALVDLDTVNHYFRSREALAQLQSAGVQVVLPSLELTHADLPVVSAAVRGVFRQPTLQVLVDLGGDAVGARMLGQFAEEIAGSAEFLLVLNPFRPRTATLQGALAEASAVQAAARLSWTGLIANPNLGPGTTVDDVLLGVEAAAVVAEALAIPLLAVTVRRDLAAGVRRRLPRLTVEPIAIHLDRAPGSGRIGGRGHGFRCD